MYRIQMMPSNSLSGIARHYHDPNADALADYDKLCVLNWEPEAKEVWVHGLMGQSSYRSLREFVLKLEEMGFERVRALRKEGHVLPRATEHPDGRGLVIELNHLHKRAHMLK